MWMGKILSNVLVTGGAGYIGSVLVPRLLALGHNVTVIDNFMYKVPSLAHLAREKNLKIEFGDVRDQHLMSKIIAKSDVIIPLAAIVGAPACSKDQVLASSINKDSILWLFSKLSDSQQIIMPTTNSAYGKGKEGEVFTATHEGWFWFCPVWISFEWDDTACPRVRLGRIAPG